MAFKILGSLFDKIISKSDVDKISERIDSISKVDLSGLSELEAALEALDEEALSSAENIARLESELAGVAAGTARERELKRDLADENKNAARLTKEEKEMREKMNKLALENNKETQVQQTLSKTLGDTTKEYKEELKKLTDALSEGKLSVAEYETNLSALKTKNFANVVKALTGNVEGSVTEGLESVMGGAIDMIANGLGPYGKILAEVVKKFIGDAIKQVMESNDILTDLKRQTGGLAEAKDLGYDNFGNSAERGIKSLSTAAAQANISMDQFKDSIASLYGEGFGNTMGMKADLNNSQKDLQNFGIEAARLSKLYSANIGPSVRSLVMNFGQSIGEATENMAQGALEARALGINVGSFVEKFDQIVGLIGKVYVSSTEGMKNLAMYASQLNISVSELAGGIIKTKSLNDLFINQQKTLAMGLATTSSQLSKIYALNVRGQGDKAAKLEIASLAQDVIKLGGTDKKGVLNTAGIQTLEAMNLSQEQNKAVGKAIMEMEVLKHSFANLTGEVKLNEKQLKAATLAELENVKAAEQFANLGKQLQAVIIDPLATAIGPLIQFIGVLASGIMSVVGWLMEVLPIGSALKGIGEVFSWLSERLVNIGMFLSGIWAEVEPVVRPFLNFFKWLGEAIGNLAGIFIAIKIGFMIAASPILLVIAKLALAIAIVVGVFYLLRKGFEILYNKFDWFRNIVDAVVRVFNKLKESFSNFKWPWEDDEEVAEASKNQLGAKSWEEVYQKQGQGGISSQVKNQIEVISTASKGQADFIKTFTIQQAQAKESKQPLNITVQQKVEGTFDSEAQTKRTINL